VIVAAADHGVHAQGVSRWPQQVTASMVGLFCAGRAAVNAIAASVGARVAVLDVGVASEVAGHPRLRRARVRNGTEDLSQGPAMTREEAARAVLAGAGLAEELVGAGVDLLVPGDMGIANTTAAACLIAALTGAGAGAVTGPGAGAGPAMLARKREVVAAALALHRPDPTDPLGVLAAVGGLEHAALAGVILAGAAERVPVVLDGVSADAAALVATALQPDALGYLVAGHRSTEPGAAVALDRLGLVPVLDLGLRLGEGTGGLLAVPIVAAAARVLAETATIAESGPLGV
jgi:nicotinate-nucleotide--dimethylbenzimidazole phosphoribosyltransferase